MSVQLLSFILIASHYLFTGIANGGGYAKRPIVQYLGIAGQVILAGVALHFVPLTFVNLALAFLASASFSLTKLSFDGKVSFGDVHLFTYLGTAFFCLLVCYDISLLGLLGVYPGLLLEKGMINLGSNLDFFDDRTDDPTGETFGVPSLGIKVPRIGTAYRIPLAVLSLVAVGAAILIKFNHTLHQFF